jgi:glycosyltransferase involved in cell wall biosynthesis
MDTDLKIVVYVKESKNLIHKILNKNYPNTIIQGLNFLLDKGLDVTFLNSLTPKITMQRNPTVIFSLRINKSAIIHKFLSISFNNKIKLICLDLSIYENDNRIKLKRFLVNNIFDLTTYNTITQKYIFKYYRFNVNKMLYLPWSIDADFFTPTKIEEEDFILAVGDANRDYITLIKAIKDLNVKLIIATRNLSFRGKFSYKLQDLIMFKNNNIYIKEVSIDELKKLYEKAKLVVLPLIPSLTGAGVTALLEAFSMSKPVIVSDSPGLKEYCMNDINCIVIKPYDWKSLQMAVLNLLNDDKKRKRLGVNARNFILENYSTKKTAEKIYNNIIIKLTKEFVI